MKTRLLAWVGFVLSILFLVFVVTAGFGMAEEMTEDDILIAKYMHAGSAVATLLHCSKYEPDLGEVAETQYKKLESILKPHVNEPDTVLGRASRATWTVILQTKAKLQYLHFDEDEKTFMVLPIIYPDTCKIAFRMILVYNLPGEILHVPNRVEALAPDPPTIMVEESG